MTQRGTGRKRSPQEEQQQKKLASLLRDYEDTGCQKTFGMIFHYINPQLQRGLSRFGSPTDPYVREAVSDTWEKWVTYSTSGRGRLIAEKPNILGWFVKTGQNAWIDAYRRRATRDRLAQKVHLLYYENSHEDEVVGSLIPIEKVQMAIEKQPSELDRAICRAYYLRGQDQATPLTKSEIVDLVMVMGDLSKETAYNRVTNTAYRFSKMIRSLE